MFIPKYNARFALLIDNNKNKFICLDKHFDYNKELAVWSEHKVYHNSYLKYDKHYHIILKDNEKCYLSTFKKVKVYTLLDGTNHILFNNQWYDIKTVKNFQDEISKAINSSKIKEEIKISKTHKPNNSPWRKGLPMMPSKKSSAYAYFRGC